MKEKKTAEKKQLLVSFPFIAAIMANRYPSISNYSKKLLLHSTHQEKKCNSKDRGSHVSGERKKNKKTNYSKFEISEKCLKQQLEMG